MNSERVFIISGEASGDLHAANLVNAWKKINPTMEFVAWGGDRLIAEHVKVLKHIRELSFMGFLEVFLNIFTILKNFKTCKAQLVEFNPSVIVLVDFPGFNLRIAEWAKKHGIHVVYYISPQLWAWKQNRVKKIKKYVDELYCILPFERDFYENFGMRVHYFGHPLLDEIERFNHSNQNKIEVNKPILALLPGSRLQEIKRKLPIMLEASKAFKEFDVIVACSTQLSPAYFDSFKCEGVRFEFGKTYEILQQASFAFVTSGTATLETALFEVPQVVCYKSSPLSFWIAKRVVKIKYISLVNLILGEGLVEELIQNDCNSDQLVRSLKKLTTSVENKEQIIAGYKKLKVTLGGKGASERIAFSIHETFFK